MLVINIFEKREANFLLKQHPATGVLTEEFWPSLVTRLLLFRLVNLYDVTVNAIRRSSR